MRFILLGTCLLAYFLPCSGRDRGTEAVAADGAAQQASAGPQVERGKDSAPPPKRLDAAYIAGDFTVAVVVHPLRILKSAAVEELLKDESFAKRAERFFAAVVKDSFLDMRRAEEHLGPRLAVGVQHFDPRRAEQIVLLTGPRQDNRLFGQTNAKKGNSPNGPQTPGVRDLCRGAIFRFRDRIDKGILLLVMPEGGPDTHEGKTYYWTGLGPRIPIHFPDERTAVVAAEESLMKGMLSASKRDSELAARLAETEIDHDVVGVAVLPPMRVSIRNELADKTTEGAVKSVDAFVGDLLAVTLTVDISDDVLITVALDAGSPESARRIEELAQQGLGIVKQTFAKRRDKANEEVRVGRGQAIAALPEGVLAAATTERNGRRVLVHVKTTPRGIEAIAEALARAISDWHSGLWAIAGRRSDYPALRREQLTGQWREETPTGEKLSLALNADGSGSWTSRTEEVRFRYDPQAIDLSPEPVESPFWAGESGWRVFEPSARIRVTLLDREKDKDDSKAALFVRLLEPGRMVVVLRTSQPTAPEPQPVWRLMSRPVVLRQTP